MRTALLFLVARCSSGCVWRQKDVWQKDVIGQEYFCLACFCLLNEAAAPRKQRAIRTDSVVWTGQMPGVPGCDILDLLADVAICPFSLDERYHNVRT
jgi:hypothetical protein